MYTIAYIGNFGFPDKNASGKRVLGNCKALQKYGFHVVCIGPGNEKKYNYEGISVYSIDRGNNVQRVLKNQNELVKEIIANEHVDSVILYGAIFTEKRNIELIKWCHDKKISVVYDQVDWLDINWHNIFRGLIRANNQRLMNTRVIPMCDGMICISEYLAQYHSLRGRRTLVIPPLSTFSCAHKSESADRKDKIYISYAGTTSDVQRPMDQWKDRIDTMFEKLLEVQKSGSIRPVVLNIYGMTTEQYFEMFPLQFRAEGEKIIRQLGESVIFHGVVPNADAVNGIKQSDFTLLVRDKKRETMSGFPTKVSESISCGVPVLSNDTSDIKNYIINGKNGFVMDDITEMFKLAFSLDDDSLEEMKNSCMDNPFYYKKYAKDFGIFMKNIIEARRGNMNEWL